MKPIELLLATLPLLGAIAVEQVQAQVVPPVVEGTGTTVVPNSANPNQLDIGGGQTSSDGANLFHSFEQFGLNQGQIANFIQSNANIQNILARVSGGDASVINGILQVTNGSANLFLINPSGIIFGPNASLNLNGAFTATTANGIGFGSNDSNWFSATGTNNYTDLVGAPSAFAFTMEQPGAIVNAGNLSVGEGKNLTLLAGTVANTGQINAPEGAITVAAVPGESVVRISQAGNILSLNVQPLTTPTPGLNSWTLPILSLPQLLTGGGGGNATGLAVNSNGQVELVGSGIGVENGDVVIQQDINNANTVALSARNNLFAANINTVVAVFGEEPNLNEIDSSVSLSAGNNITAENINTQSILESDSPNATNSFININAGNTIRLRNIINDADLSSSDKTDGSIILSAGSDIITESISNGGTDSAETDSFVSLTSTTGNITVKTIDAGGGGIDINAFGLFRAEDTLSGSLTGEERDIELKTSPELITFFESQGFNRSDLVNSDAFVKVIDNNIDGNISLITRSRGNITIRHAGESISINEAKTDERIIIIGRDNSIPFVIGPKVSTVGLSGNRNNTGQLVDVQGEVFDPASSTLITLTRTDTYSTLNIPNELPYNASGTLGAIVISTGTDANIAAIPRDRLFTGSPPVVEPPVIEPPIIVNPPVIEPPSGGTGSSDGNGTGSGSNSGGSGNSGVVINPDRTEPGSGSTNNNGDTANDTNDSSEDNPDLQSTQTAMARQPQTLDFGILVLDKSLVASLKSTGHATRLSVGSDGTGELTGSDLEAEDEEKISQNHHLSTYPEIYLSDNSYRNVQK